MKDMILKLTINIFAYAPFAVPMAVLGYIVIYALIPKII